MKLITFTQPNGLLAVFNPWTVTGQPCEPFREGETEAQWLARLASKVTSGASHSLVDHTALPARDYRAAWKLAAGVVTVDAELKTVMDDARATGKDPAKEVVAALAAKQTTP